jgi:hypothetical protein
MATTSTPTPAHEKLDAQSESSLQQKSTHVSLFGKIKHRFRNKCAEWAPLMKAKSNLDSEYSFVPGRYAGQGLGPNGKD